MQNAIAEQHNSLSHQISQLAALIGAQQQLPQQTAEEEEEASAEDFKQFKKFLNEGAKKDRERSPRGRAAVAAASNPAS